MIEFKEADHLGGWSIAVVKSGVTVGHIRKHGYDGRFVYYKGSHNELNGSKADLKRPTKKALEAPFLLQSISTDYRDLWAPTPSKTGCV